MLRNYVLCDYRSEHNLMNTIAIKINNMQRLYDQEILNLVRYSYIGRNNRIITNFVVIYSHNYEIEFT